MQKMEMSNLFFDEAEAGEGVEPAQIARRYRKLALATTRSSCAGTASRSSAAEAAHDGVRAQRVRDWRRRRWRQKIDSQKRVPATDQEQLCKLAKWTAVAARGRRQMKIGYVSRVARTNPYEHVILSTKFYKPRSRRRSRST